MRHLPAVLVLLAAALGSALPPGQQQCREVFRPHPTRCDQFLRCALLPSKTTVWLTTQCQKGLVYQHSYGVCVVPDGSWECDLSVEGGQTRSKENVYGIDSLLLLPSKQNGGSATLASGTKRAQYKPPAVFGDESSGIDIVLDEELNNRTRIRSTYGPPPDELESSGDGSLEADGDVFADHHFTFSRPTPEVAGAPALEPVDRFASAYANHLFRGEAYKGSLPLPANGKIHPEHLTHIIDQQKQLNRIATEMKQHEDPTGGAGDRSPFTNQAVFSRKPVLLAGANAEVAGPNVEVTGPYVSEDIIRSILQISQQMMKHSSSEGDPRPEPASKPVFIPISASAVPPADELHTKGASIFDAKPIGIHFTNPYASLANSMVYDNLRHHPPAKAPLPYNTLQPTFAEPFFGNRFPTYDAKPGMGQSFPSVMVPPGHPQPASSYTGISSSYNVAPPSGQAVMYVNQQQGPPFGGGTQYELPDRIELQNSIEFDASDVNGGDDSAQASWSGETSYESPVVDSVFKRKLFPPPDTALQHNQYKHSILPLLDASPDEVRLSVVPCTIGSRQPNETDCFKYYVCNPHNGAFHSFTCPSYTAFNTNSRLCDTASYKACQQHQAPLRAVPSPVVHNEPVPPAKQSFNRLASELLTAQTYVELIRREADKLSIRHNIPPAPVETSIVLPPTDATVDSNGPQPETYSPVKLRRQSSPTGKKRKPVTRSSTSTTTTTTTAAPVTTKRRKAITTKVSRCRHEGRMPDPATRHNYYVCHRKSAKRFVRMKMTCPTGLIYCPGVQYCTTAAHC